MSLLVGVYGSILHWMGLSCRGEAGELHSKKDLIMTARQIAKESEEIVKMARLVADSCTDKRLKRVRSSFTKATIYIYSNTCISVSQAILQVIDKIPTISTQLKIIATVKATRSGDGACNNDQWYV